MGYDLINAGKKTEKSSKPRYDLMQYAESGGTPSPLPLERRFSQPNTAPIPSATPFKMIPSHTVPEVKQPTNYGAAWARGTLGSLTGRALTPLAEKLTGRKIDISTLPESNTLGEKALGMVGNLGADLPLWMAGDALLAKPLGALAKTAPVANVIGKLGKLAPALGTGVRAGTTYGGPINALETAMNGDGAQGFTDRLKEAPLMGLGGAALHGAGQAIGKGVKSGVDYARFNKATQLPEARVNPLKEVQNAYKNKTTLRDAQAQQLDKTFADTSNNLGRTGQTIPRQGMNPDELLQQKQLDAQGAFGQSRDVNKYRFTTSEQRAFQELQDGITEAQNYARHTDVLAPYPPGTTIEQAYADIKANTGVDLPKLMKNWNKTQTLKNKMTPEELRFGRVAGVVPPLKPRDTGLPSQVGNQLPSARLQPPQERMTWTNREPTQNVGQPPIRSITPENLGQLPGRQLGPVKPPIPIKQGTIQSGTPNNGNVPLKAPNPMPKDTKQFWQNVNKELFSKGEQPPFTLELMKKEIKEGKIDISKLSNEEEIRRMLGMDLQKFSSRQSIQPTSGINQGTIEQLPEPQSKIIIGKPKERMGFKEALEKFYTKTVNTQQPIVRAGKLTESDIGKLASNTKNVSGIVDYNFLKEMVNKNGEKVGESLKSTIDKIPKKQEEDFWTYMSQRHNIDRAREGKPVQANYTPSMSEDAVKNTELANPEYKAIGDGIVKWIDNFMTTWGVDTGIVNKDIYKDLRKTYKSYFPTQREFSELEKSIPDNVSQKFADQRTPLRSATGSERNIMDPVENIMNLVNRTIRTAKYNEVGQSLLESVRSQPEKLKALAEEMPAKEGMFANTDNVISVLENGKPIYLKINDKMLLDAMNGLPKTIGNIPVVSTLVNGFKSLITQKNPLFAIRNIFRDIPTAYVYGSEPNPLKFGAGLVGAGKDILTQGPRLQKYQAVGGGGANFFNQGDVTRSATELTGKENIVKKLLTSPIKAIEKFNNLTETVPRLAEFNRVLDKTGDVTKALYASNDVTVNFARGGNYTKAADKVVPYLNAGVQGLDKFFRGFMSPKVALATIAKSGVAITTPTIALYMLNKNNPNYQTLDNRTKDTYFLIPKEDGTFIKIPKSRELGVLFSSLFERVSRMSEGQKEPFKGFVNTVATNFSPANPIENNIIAPLAINIPKNKDFANRAIVPQGMLMDKRSPYLQYDDKTTSIAKSIGELSKSTLLPGGLSPKQIDYLVKSYSGVIGQFGIPLLTPGGSPSKTLRSQFVADPTFSNQVTTDFFDKFDKLSAAAVDKNIIQKIPSKKLTPEEDMRNSMSNIISALSRGTKEINKIQSSSNPRKDDKIKSIKTEMINAQKKAVDADTPKEMQTVENWAKIFFKEKK